MTHEAARIVPLVVAARRRPSPQERVVYALARLRVADLREPPAPLARPARMHD